MVSFPHLKASSQSLSFLMASRTQPYLQLKETIRKCHKTNAKILKKKQDYTCMLTTLLSPSLIAHEFLPSKMLKENSTNLPSLCQPNSQEENSRPKLKGEFLERSESNCRKRRNCSNERCAWRSIRPALLQAMEMNFLSSKWEKKLTLVMVV